MRFRTLALVGAVVAGTAVLRLVAVGGVPTGTRNMLLAHTGKGAGYVR